MKIYIFSYSRSNVSRKIVNFEETVAKQNNINLSFDIQNICKIYALDTGIEEYERLNLSLLALPKRNTDLEMQVDKTVSQKVNFNNYLCFRQRQLLI